MSLSEMDKNVTAQQITEGGRVYYTIPHSSFSLFGISYEQKSSCFVRMPTAAAEKVSEGIASVYSKQTSGGRLCFSTDSASLQISVTYSKISTPYTNMPLTGSSGFSLLEKTAVGQKCVASLVPKSTDGQGFVAETALQGGKMRTYILYFPLCNDVKTLTIALDENAKVERSDPYRAELPILYYGSSITQGNGAARPDSNYQALISKWNGINYINLGFNGSAKAEDGMVDYLAGIDCSLFVCDYDHNAPTAEYLKNTHFRLYKRYRKVQPNTPILFISKPDITNDIEGEERLKIIKSTYLKAKRSGDNNVYFLSGKSFYGAKNRWDFSADGCHPTDLGFYKMANTIYKKMISIDRKFGGIVF